MKIEKSLKIARAITNLHICIIAHSQIAMKSYKISGAIAAYNCYYPCEHLPPYQQFSLEEWPPKQIWCWNNTFKSTHLNPL